MRMLVINEVNMAEVKRVLDFAEQPSNYYIVGSGGFSFQYPPGDDVRHVARLDDGFRCVFSITKTKGGLFRHLSISVPSKDYPNPFAAYTIAQMFGFTGWNEKDVTPPPEGWLMDIHKDEHCIVLAQPINGDRATRSTPQPGLTQSTINIPSNPHPEITEAVSKVVQEYGPTLQQLAAAPAPSSLVTTAEDEEPLAIAQARLDEAKQWECFTKSHASGDDDHYDPDCFACERLGELSAEVNRLTEAANGDSTTRSTPQSGLHQKEVKAMSEELLGACGKCKAPNSVSIAAERRGYWCEKCLKSPAIESPLRRRLAEWLHALMCSAQNLPWSEGTSCSECDERVDNELLPMMLLLQATAANGDSDPRSTPQTGLPQKEVHE
jgi:hypothetical protein